MQCKGACRRMKEMKEIYVSVRVRATLLYSVPTALLKNPQRLSGGSITISLAGETNGGIRLCFMAIINYAWLFSDSSTVSGCAVERLGCRLFHWWYNNPAPHWSHCATCAIAVAPQMACSQLWRSKVGKSQKHTHTFMCGTKSWSCTEGVKYSREWALVSPGWHFEVTALLCAI